MRRAHRTAMSTCFRLSRITITPVKAWCARWRTACNGWGCRASTSYSSTTSTRRRTAPPIRGDSATCSTVRCPRLAALKAAGAIAGFGLGVNDVDICLDTLRHADLDVILLAGRYTLADQSAFDGAAAGMRAARRDDRARRPVQFRHPGQRFAPARWIATLFQLRARAGRGHRTCRGDRTRVRRACRAAQGRGAAVSSRPSGDSVRAARRAVACRVRR